MQHKKRLESVGITNHADDISERIAGQYIIPIGKFNEYQKEVKKYTDEAANIYNFFLSKEITKAVDYCNKNNLKYSICKE